MNIFTKYPRKLTSSPFYEVLLNILLWRFLYKFSWPNIKGSTVWMYSLTFASWSSLQISPYNSSLKYRKTLVGVRVKAQDAFFKQMWPQNWSTEIKLGYINHKPKRFWLWILSQSALEKIHSIQCRRLTTE